MLELTKQMEYYFSDANLRKDKFLSAEIAKNSDGWTPLSLFSSSFNRIKEKGADVPALAKALESSTNVELNEDRTCVRRLRPLLSSGGRAGRRRRRGAGGDGRRA